MVVRVFIDGHQDLAGLLQPHLKHTHTREGLKEEGEGEGGGGGREHITY